MHKYLRAVGFSEYTEKKQIQSLVKEIIVHADERSCMLFYKSKNEVKFLHKYLRAVGFSEYTEKKQIQSLVKEIIVHADERSCTLFYKSKNEVKFLHKYLRAVGFSEYTEKKQIQSLVKEIIVHADERSCTTLTEKSLIAEFDRNFAEDIGIAVCGEFDDEDNYTFDYYFPYLRSETVSSGEDISIERHAAKESYAGICDDPRVGVSLIFYLQNMIPYLKLQGEGRLPIRGTSLNLSALSCHGTIMMPIQKSERQKKKIARDTVERNRLIQAARGGDEEAIENLTLEDMDTYTAISKKIQKADIFSARDTVERNRLIQAARGGDEEAIENLTLEDMDTYTAISKKIQKADIFSLVDTYFMPYGVECDQYSILGEITDMKRVKNSMTGENVYILTVCCNDLNMKVGINSMDLMGEPAVGRRFKGSVWLQGYVNYPDA